MLDKLNSMADKEGKEKRYALHALYNANITDEFDDDIIYDSLGNARIGHDYVGTTYFKELLKMLYYTQYAGSLSAEEQADALANAPMVMRMAVKLRDDIPNASSCYYVYEFYRCADRRVMVRLYQAEKADGEFGAVSGYVSDFYISTGAFNKIVSNFYALLNVRPFDTEQAYPSYEDFSKK
jgi:hypothetical protein